MTQILHQDQDSARFVVRNAITGLLFAYESFMRAWIVLLTVLV